eukprot:gene3230-19824_t
MGLAAARWLLFVVIFEAGAGKLLSMPLPTPAARLLHARLPRALHRAATAAALLAELVAPLLVLHPFGRPPAG